MKSDWKVARHLGCVMVLVSGCAFGTEDADLVEVGSIDDELIYGRFDLDRSNDFVVLVDRDHIEHGLSEPTCSGVLVTPRYVLTDVDCLPDFSSSGSQSPNQWYPIPFTPTRSSDATSAVKTSFRMDVSASSVIEGFDYPLHGASSATSLPACSALCSAAASCDGFTFNSRSNTCHPKRRGVRIRFGGSLASAPTFSARATQQARPMGRLSDSRLVLLQLEQAVPTSIATPVPVLTSVEGSLLKQRVRGLGFGGSPIRQIAEGEIVGLSPRGSLAFHDLILARFDGSSQLVDGDEGSALLIWARGRWNLIGQGIGMFRGTTPVYTGVATRGSAHYDDIATWLEAHIVAASHSDRDGRFMAVELSGDGRSELMCHDQISGGIRAMWATTGGTHRNEHAFGVSVCLGEPSIRATSTVTDTKTRSAFVSGIPESMCRSRRRPGTTCLTSWRGRRLHA